MGFFKVSACPCSTIRPAHGPPLRPACGLPACGAKKLTQVHRGGGGLPARAGVNDKIEHNKAEQRGVISSPRAWGKRLD